MRRNLTIGDLVESGEADIQTGPFGTQLRASDYVEEGIPVINVRNLGIGDLRPDKLEFVTAATAERLSTHLLEPRDIVFGRKGAVDRHLFVNDSQRMWMQGSDCIRLRLSARDIDPRFVSYALRTPAHQDWILAQAGNKATMASLNQDIIKRISLDVPSRVVQERIVSILASYDDLCDTHHRRMIRLEEAARHLFHKWFTRLQFTCDASYQGSPDWNTAPLGSNARFLSGGTPSKARPDYWEGDIPWVSSGELTSMRIARTPLNISAEAAESGSRVVPPETILAVVRGMSLAKEFRIGLTSRPMAFNQDLKAIVPNPGVDSLYLYHALEAKREEIRDHASEASHGTKKLDTAVLASIPLLIPPQSVQRQFREFVAPLHALWDNLDLQNEKLRAARDLLLPRLMSGQLVV